MEPYFSDFHVSASHQLNDGSHPLPRTADSYDGWMALGKELSHTLNYREAIQAYTHAIALSPGQRDAYRQRAGKYLATLQTENAMTDFEHCRVLGGNEDDLSYRMGLCRFYAGAYSMAIREFRHCWEVCDEELGIGAIYWSMIAAWRIGREPEMLRLYHDDLHVGHHTGYAFAVKVALGKIRMNDALEELAAEKEDLEFSLKAYGVAAWFDHIGQRETAVRLYREILARDDFWISFAFLAAWNDRRNGRI